VEQRAGKIQQLCFKHDDRLGAVAGNRDRNYPDHAVLNATKDQ
jgi:hypothetical protein